MSCIPGLALRNKLPIAPSARIGHFFFPCPPFAGSINRNLGECTVHRAEVPSGGCEIVTSDLCLPRRVRDPRESVCMGGLYVGSEGRTACHVRASGHFAYVCMHVRASCGLCVSSYYLRLPYICPSTPAWLFFFFFGALHGSERVREGKDRVAVRYRTVRRMQPRSALHAGHCQHSWRERLGPFFLFSEWLILTNWLDRARTSYG